MVMMMMMTVIDLTYRYLLFQKSHRVSRVLYLVGALGARCSEASCLGLAGGVVEDGALLVPHLNKQAPRTALTVSTGVRTAFTIGIAVCAPLLLSVLVCANISRVERG
jgi:hypothetical protein